METEYIIKVLVQLPDGKFGYCPVARWNEGKPQVVSQPTEREAKNWKDFILPERAEVYKKGE